MSEISRRDLLKGSLAAVGVGAVSLLGNEASAKPTSEQSSAETFDAVIIGAGCAGLVCAIETYDRGGKPVVLEKMGNPFGNSVFALGSVAVTGTRMQKAEGFEDSVDAFYEDMMKVSMNHADPELVRYYAENSADAVHWLADEVGVKFKKLSQEVYPILSRAHRVDTEGTKGMTGGGMLIRKLLAAIKKRNIPVVYHAKAIELLTNNKLEVTGVRALTPDGLKDYNARGGVLIASGGFSGNHEMLTMYMGGWASNLVTRGSPYVTGENISLTRPLGAQLVNMDQFHGGPIVGATHANPTDLINAGFGIVVSPQGKRIIDEAETYVAKAKALPKLVPQNIAYQVCDSNSENKKLEGVAQKYVHLNTTLYKANTLEELAKAAGFPEKEFVTMIKEYNAALDNKTLDKLVPPNTLKKPYPIKQAPFYAFPFEGGMTATFGGPKINTRAEIVNTERKPIPGLYAAGNAAGGLFYNDYIGGCQLGGATIFGRVAAREMVVRSKAA
jgi:Succinate dehydrogenase/fumarate reductase, flavoprotein subunit